MPDITSSFSNLRPFQKGQSGNGLGLSIIARKWGAEIRKRTMYGQEMMDYLLENLRDPKCNEMIRFRSAEMLIKYGVGEPSPDGTAGAYDFSKLSEADKAIMKLLYERSRVDGGDAGPGAGTIMDTTGEVRAGGPASSNAEATGVPGPSV